MKLKVEVDLTAKEFRDAVGLPDIAGIQKEIIDAVKQQMHDGVEGFDPVSLFKSFISQGMVTAGEMQRLVERFMSMGTQSKNKNGKKES